MAEIRVKPALEYNRNGALRCMHARCNKHKKLYEIGPYYWCHEHKTKGYEYCRLKGITPEYKPRAVEIFRPVSVPVRAPVHVPVVTPVVTPVITQVVTPIVTPVATVIPPMVSKPFHNYKSIMISTFAFIVLSAIVQMPIMYYSMIAFIASMVVTSGIIPIGVMVVSMHTIKRLPDITFSKCTAVHCGQHGSKREFNGSWCKIHHKIISDVRSQINPHDMSETELVARIKETMIRGTDRGHANFTTSLLIRHNGFDAQSAFSLLLFKLSLYIQ